MNKGRVKVIAELVGEIVMSDRVGSFCAKRLNSCEERPDQRPSPWPIDMQYGDTRLAPLLPMPIRRRPVHSRRSRRRRRWAEIPTDTISRLVRFSISHRMTIMLVRHRRVVSMPRSTHSHSHPQMTTRIWIEPRSHAHIAIIGIGEDTLDMYLWLHMAVTLCVGMTTSRGCRWGDRGQRRDSDLERDDCT